MSRPNDFAPEVENWHPTRLVDALFVTGTWLLGRDSRQMMRDSWADWHEGRRQNGWPPPVEHIPADHSDPLAYPGPELDLMDEPPRPVAGEVVTHSELIPPPRPTLNAHLPAHRSALPRLATRTQKSSRWLEGVAIFFLVTGVAFVVALAVSGGAIGLEAVGAVLVGFGAWVVWRALAASR